MLFYTVKTLILVDTEKSMLIGFSDVHYDDSEVVTKTLLIV